DVYFASSLRLSSFQRTIKKSFERIAPSKLNKQRSCTNCFVWLKSPACLASAPNFSAVSIRPRKSKSGICSAGSPTSVEVEQSPPLFLLSLERR
ncbi:hypothetical protein M3610_27640, partial [Neobacillus sp. MER 74]|uniref:hypothetical protein n=1 Tax=Neobacillus sp. MER 74 TaxID=2939566 RepID=UPI0020421EFC